MIFFPIPHKYLANNKSVQNKNYWTITLGWQIQLEQEGIKLILKWAILYGHKSIGFKDLVILALTKRKK